MTESVNDQRWSGWPDEAGADDAGKPEKGAGDLVAAAVNDAVRRGEALSQEKMAGFTAGLNLPPGLKLPF